MAETMWMVRAGEGGYLVEEFKKGYVAIGWGAMDDLSPTGTQDEIWSTYERAYPNEKPGKAANAVAVLYKFRAILQEGGKVVTYDPEAREYWIGMIQSDYYYQPEVIPEYAHLRKVEWIGQVGRDRLSPSEDRLGKWDTLKT